MATLGQRILRRAVPVGVLSGLAGFGLLWGYLSAVRGLADVQVESSGPTFVGPLVLGLAGFAIMAAIECVRPPKPPIRS